MKKVILQYLASALAVILILGLVVFNRQRNHSLVKKVKDPEISYIYQDSLENIDRLALSQAGVIQSYQLDALSVRKEDGKIHLVLHINHSYDMQVNLVLKSDIYGDLSVVQATPSKALKLALEDESYQKRLTLISQKADAIMARDHWDQGIKPAYVAQVRSKMKKTSLNQLKRFYKKLIKKVRKWARIPIRPFSKLLNCLITTSSIWLWSTCRFMWISTSSSS